ncbi:hypothetical protein HK100_001080 [Physocladia obscura]|uniref:Uncharacterized protein n=1 Tax=Physocladia obscura TaxID=109957 RepID=A0AAD5T077_9FUNG|nr:hypothetical protein HK100_001080 [Physocladia obscura]
MTDGSSPTKPHHMQMHSAQVMDHELMYRPTPVRRTNSIGSTAYETQLGRSPSGRYMAPPMPRRNGYIQPQQQYGQYNEWGRSDQDDEEVRALREQLEIAKQVIERQAYANKVLAFQQRLQAEQVEQAHLQQLYERSRSVPGPHQQKSPQYYSVSSHTSSNSSAVGSYSSSAGVVPTLPPNNNVFRPTSAGSKNSDEASIPSTGTSPKSVSGWTGKSSIRYSNDISDIIIDEICNLDEYPTFPHRTAIKCIAKIKEYYYQSSGRGTGANMAIMAILYVCDLGDPEFTRRGLETLEFFYSTAGILFWASVSVNLNFWVHFLEHGKFLTVAEKADVKPMTQLEKDNVKFLCHLFASWYLVDASKDDMEAVGIVLDPTVFIKNFFEALYRAGYEFPPGSLDHIPADKIKAITAWSLKKPPFTLNKV